MSTASPNGGDRKTYRPSMPSTWWLKKGSYFLFMMRELSSVFIAAFVLLFMWELFQLSEGAETYGQFRESLRQPGYVAFFAIAFVFAVYHTITWFGAASKIQVVRLGSRTVPPAMVTGGAIAGWVVASVAIAVFFLS